MDGGIAIGPERRDGLGTGYRPFRTFSADGLALAGRIYGPAETGSTATGAAVASGPAAAAAAPCPLVCLPGLTRNGRDFEPVAARFAAGRRVVTIDFRGRGASEYAVDPSTYQPAVEAADTLAMLDRLGLGPVVILGTSRGGLVGMAMAAMRPDGASDPSASVRPDGSDSAQTPDIAGLSDPTARLGRTRRARVAGLILNDIGPAIERSGLMRIKGYVGVGPAPETWAAAVAALRATTGDQFPALDEAGWDRKARRIFREIGGRPAFDYDPALALGLAGLTDDSPIPTVWPLFAALAGRPVLVIRGVLSDILSEETVTAMAAAHPGLAVHRVPDQGHAPLLEDAATLDRIDGFLAAMAVGRPHPIDQDIPRNR